MITWISRILPTTGALLAFAACDGDIGLATAVTEPPAMIKAPMAAGNVVLVPPQGYCIDSRSLKQRFALMARCDSLTDAAGTGGAAVGVITISLTDLDPAQPLPQAETIVEAAAVQNLRDVDVTDDRLTFRVDGPPPQERLAQTHWRGIARINGFAMSVALYGPRKGRAVTSEGREMIMQLIAATRTQSESSES